MEYLVSAGIPIWLARTGNAKPGTENREVCEPEPLNDTNLIGGGSKPSMLSKCYFSRRILPTGHLLYINYQYTCIGCRVLVCVMCALCRTSHISLTRNRVQAAGIIIIYSMLAYVACKQLLKEDIDR